jgi:hypothetical protein
MALKFIPQKNDKNIGEQFFLNNSIDGLSLNGFVIYPNGYMNNDKLIMNNIVIEDSEIALNNMHNGKNIILDCLYGINVAIPYEDQIEKGFFCYLTMTNNTEFAYILFDKGTKIIGDTSFYTKKHDIFVWNYKSPTRPSLIEWNRVKLIKIEDGVWYLTEGTVGIWWID